jgi:hypothetical protein
MITGKSRSLLRKAYLGPEDRGLSSMVGLGGSSNSSRGSGSIGFFIFLLDEKLGIIFKVGFDQIIKRCNLTSPIGPSLGIGSVLAFRE